MKKICFTILILLMISLANAETITLVTYYPSPFGAYEELYLHPETEALVDPCDIGTMLFSQDNKLMVCQNNGAGAGEWFYSLLWGKDNNDIYSMDVDEPGGSSNWFFGIGTETPELKLSIENDGGILAKGSFGVGANLTTSGMSTRLIWYPKKAAFRAGRIISTQWNDFNIGNHSTSMGYNSQARGTGATALGASAIAFGNYSVALGRSSIAAGDYSMALSYMEANGDFSTAIGGALGEADGDYSTVISGHSGKTTGNYATAITGGTANGEASTAIGSHSTANGDYSLAIMGWSVADGDASVALGSRSNASGTATTAIGYEATASDLYSIAIGYRATASKSRAFALGRDVVADGYSASAIGTESSVTGVDAVSMGYNVTNGSYCSFVFGQYNEGLPATDNLWIASDPLFVIGNGADSMNKHNAVTILKNGNMGISIHDPVSPLAVEGIEEYAGNSDAIAAGLTEGAVYRTGDILKIVY